MPWEGSRPSQPLGATQGHVGGALRGAGWGWLRQDLNRGLSFRLPTARLHSDPGPESSGSEQLRPRSPCDLGSGCCVHPG